MIFDSLFRWMLFGSTMFFAAADVAMGGGDAGAEVSDVGGSESIDQVSGETVHPDDQDIAGDAAGGEEAQGQGTDEADRAEPESKVDGRAFPQEVRELVNKLQTENPKLAKQVNGAFQLQRQLYQECPGGINEIKEIKHIFADFGGKQGLTEVKSEISEYRDIDQRYIAGDPSVLENFADLNKDAFCKIVPAAIRKFSQLDPQGWEKFGAGIINTTLQQNGVNNLIFLAKEMAALGNKDKALELLGKVEEVLKGIDEAANKVVEPKKPDPNDATKTNELATRETKLFTKEVGSELTGYFNQITTKELAQYLKGKQPSQAQAESFRAECVRQINKIIRSQDQNFDANYKSYFDERDGDGLKSYVKAAWDKAKSQAVKVAYRYAFGTATLGAQDKKPAAKPPVTTAAGTVSKGWTKVAAPPKPQEIARGRGENQTTDDMILRRSAILKNGQRVYWGANAPA